MDVPPDLAAAIAAHEARIAASWHSPQWAQRVYLRLESPGGKLFARYSRDSADSPALEYEARVRAFVGTEGVLRAPPVLARGPGWLLELGIEPASAADVSLDTILSAAERLAGLDLPPSPWRQGPAGLANRLRRRLELAGSALPTRDLVRAKRLPSTLALPLVTSHGGFHPVHVLVDERAAWVVDWELSGRRPAGYDLMHYWTSIAEPEGRERLFRGAVELVGSSHEHELRLLRYAVLVRIASNKLTVDADRDGALALLSLLPEVRRQAGF